MTDDTPRQRRRRGPDAGAAVESSSVEQDFGRQPPHNLAAEQAVLGGMLLSKDAIADVVETIRPDDFYRPSHQAVYDTILDLYAQGDPADSVTVATALARRGELNRVGGAPYLLTLTQAVPTAANAGYYAGIVAEKAILRRLVEAGTRIAQYGYAGAEGDDVAAVVDRAQATLYQVSERNSSQDCIPLADLMQPLMDELDALTSEGNRVGIPTGFGELDDLTTGLHPGQMIIVAARPGVGKALALDTPLPTPGGWTTMGEVAVGEYLLDKHGNPTRVVAATEVMYERPCYRVHFDDGAEIVADADHEWVTLSSRYGLSPGVRTTQRVAATLLDAHGKPNHKIPNGRRGKVRRITAVDPIDSVPVRCVQVANSDHLFLAGPTQIPTRNSTLALDFTRSAAIKHKLPSVFFSLEMSRSELTMRLLSAEAGIRLADMRKGQMSDQDWARLARKMGELDDVPLFIDDSANLTMTEIRAKARRLKLRHGLKFMVVDYLQLLTSGKKVESRQQEVSEFSRNLKLLAKELEIPVVAISQLNRGPEQRQDKLPMVSDLRESGSLEQDSDLVILLHRPDRNDPNDPRAGEADLIVGKNRQGPTRTIAVADQLSLSRFTPLYRG
ncbi:replicative DNA helicase [Nocardia asiatica]|uniref:replicative DNA helicase n=1 Tax=Nocardia asiatica TaxID=209252 RepID=UPI0006843EE5